MIYFSVSKINSAEASQISLVDLPLEGISDRQSGFSLISRIARVYFRNFSYDFCEKFVDRFDLGASFSRKTFRKVDLRGRSLAYSGANIFF